MLESFGKPFSYRLLYFVAVCGMDGEENGMIGVKGAVEIFGMVGLRGAVENLLGMEFKHE